MAQGGGGLDHSAMVKALEQLSNIELGESSSMQTVGAKKAEAMDEPGDPAGVPSRIPRRRL